MPDPLDPTASPDPTAAPDPGEASQPQQAPQGAAIPQGYTIGTPPPQQSQQQPVQRHQQRPQPQGGNAIPAGYTIGTPQPQQQPHPKPQQPSSNGSPSGGGGFFHSVWNALDDDHLTDVAKGAVKGVLSTTSGLGDIIHKAGEAIHPGLGEAIIPASGLQAEQQYSETHNTAQNVGYAGETLAEFMLGDEALKGLSMSDKLLKIGKVTKALEASPRLMHALKIGSAAVRAGIVQGAQTTVRTGGDVGQGVQAGTTMAATSGVLGGLTGAVSGVLGKGARAANTVQEMSKVAESAPTSVVVGSQLSSAVNDAFSGERTAATNQLGSATGTITDLASGAPENSAITDSAQTMAKNANKAMHDRYASGVRELSSMTQGQSVPYVGSPLHQAAWTSQRKARRMASPLTQPLTKPAQVHPKRTG